MSVPLTGHAEPDRAPWLSADAGSDDAVGAVTVAPSAKLPARPRGAAAGVAGLAGATVAGVPSSGRLVATGSEAGRPASEAGAGFPGPLDDATGAPWPRPEPEPLFEDGPEPFAGFDGEPCDAGAFPPGRGAGSRPAAGRPWLVAPAPPLPLEPDRFAVGVRVAMGLLSLEPDRFAVGVRVAAGLSPACEEPELGCLAAAGLLSVLVLVPLPLPASADGGVDPPRDGLATGAVGDDAGVAVAAAAG